MHVSMFRIRVVEKHFRYLKRIIFINFLCIETPPQVANEKKKINIEEAVKQRAGCDQNKKSVNAL